MKTSPISAQANDAKIDRCCAAVCVYGKTTFSVLERYWRLSDTISSERNEWKEENIGMSLSDEVMNIIHFIHLAVLCFPHHRHPSSNGFPIDRFDLWAPFLVLPQNMKKSDRNESARAALLFRRDQTEISCSTKKRRRRSKKRKTKENSLSQKATTKKIQSRLRQEFSQFLSFSRLLSCCSIVLVCVTQKSRSRKYWLRRQCSNIELRWTQNDCENKNAPTNANRTEAQTRTKNCVLIDR